LVLFSEEKPSACAYGQPSFARREWKAMTRIEYPREQAPRAEPLAKHILSIIP